ncbi:hypothetical protein H920_06009 [Fukomys damarensis]|uniref:Uncharacterized protein n=1 Tax=Fukomys damarensis TaxID=885580 RepID=A0A091DQ40_FUKDA|nr:hypothetical protein H920_06009 [Fukomys damarensis]
MQATRLSFTKRSSLTVKLGTRRNPPVIPGFLLLLLLKAVLTIIPAPLLFHFEHPTSVFSVISSVNQWQPQVPEKAPLNQANPQWDSWDLSPLQSVPVTFESTPPSVKRVFYSKSQQRSCLHENFTQVCQTAVPKHVLLFREFKSNCGKIAFEPDCGFQFPVKN